MGVGVGVSVCVVVWVCGCVGVSWVCGSVGLCACGSVGVWICECVGVWVCGCGCGCLLSFYSHIHGGEGGCVIFSIFHRNIFQPVSTYCLQKSVHLGQSNNTF